MRALSLLLLGCLIAALAACAQQEGGSAWDQGRDRVTSPPPPTGAPPQIDSRQWQELYRRPGWTGGTTVDLRAVGDVMLGRFVAAAAARRGFDYPFAQARALLNGDLAIGNLESPLTERQAPLRPGPYRLPAPPAFAASLKAAGFSALALANNHALDVGPAGLQDTATALTTIGILPLGAGPDDVTARTPTTIGAAGLRVVLLSFNDVADPEDRPNEGQQWGRAWLDDAALGAVRQARGAADLVVLIVHWGQEYSANPSARQREWARRLIAAGADLIVGAHPHVLQPVETLVAEGRTGVVAYSLGNFIFDQPFSRATSAGVVLRVLLDRQGVALVAAAPVDLADGQPRPVALGSNLGQDVLKALGAATDGALQAWRWDGHTAAPVPVPSGVHLAERPNRRPADLRGDGQPLWATLDDHGLLEVRAGPASDAPVVWRNEAASWRVTRIDVGDPNDDGRIEILLLLWKPDSNGALRSHPFLMGWRGGRYRIIWGGSATATPIQDAAVADLDGDGRQELVVLEGGSAPGDPAEAVSVWHWHGWGFQREWGSEAGRWARLAVQDLEGDGRLEIVAETAPNRARLSSGDRYGKRYETPFYRSLLFQARRPRNSGISSFARFSALARGPAGLTL
jgi:poly-gamma-glutamate synthesis protein (capsule biosynthesis protein)